MSRNIEFRVWDKSAKGFDTSANFDEYLPVEYFDSTPACFLLALNDTLEDDNYVIQQFTGLLDKKGKKIFEGDIVKFCYFDSWMNNNREDIVQIVFYNQKLGAFRMGSQYVVDNHMLGAKGTELTENCEVIGNVFENSNLIK